MTETYIVTSGSLSHNPPAKLHGLQVILDPYLPQLLLAWWVLFAATFCFLVVFLVRKYLATTQTGKKRGVARHDI